MEKPRQFNVSPEGEAEEENLHKLEGDKRKRLARAYAEEDQETIDLVESMHKRTQEKINELKEKYSK